MKLFYTLEFLHVFLISAPQHKGIGFNSLYPLTEGENRIHFTRMKYGTV